MPPFCRSSLISTCLLLSFVGMCCSLGMCVNTAKPACPETESKCKLDKKTCRKIKNVVMLATHVVYSICFLILERFREIFKKYALKEVQPAGTVRISRILFKYKMDPEEISRRHDFIPSCGHFVDTEVLDNPNWHLYCIEKDRVFFVLLPRHISFYSASRFPFVYVPIFEEALALAEVPKEEFVKLGKKFFEEKRTPKTILFSNTARCGSTLMARMLDRPGDSICYGEPHALCSLSIGLKEDELLKHECKELLEAAVSCLRAYTPTDQVCVLKCTSGETNLVPLSQEIPNLKHMFMYRKKGLLSCDKICRREEFMNNILLRAYNCSPVAGRFLSSITPTMEGYWARKLKPLNIRSWAAIVYAAPYSDYLKNQNLYCHPVVWYHDLIENTENVLEKLFSAIDIPLDCVQDAVDCKKDDSQKESFLARDKLLHVEIPPVTDEDRRILDSYADSMEIPRDTFDC